MPIVKSTTLIPPAINRSSPDPVYKLTGWRITKPVVFEVSTRYCKMDKVLIEQAIEGAITMIEEVTDTPLIREVIMTDGAVKYGFDGKFTLQFTGTLKSGVLGTSKTYFALKKHTWKDKQFYDVREYDIRLKLDIQWGKEKTPYLQTVAAHELLHGLGLADLYKDLSTRKANEIMNAYRYPRGLGRGDIQGIEYLYKK